MKQEVFVNIIFPDTMIEYTCAGENEIQITFKDIDTAFVNTLRRYHFKPIF